MAKRYAGFTLIEIMIVVSVVGVIAALALPLYQGSVLKSQVSRALGELASYKAAFEVGVMSGDGVANSNLGYVPSDLTTGDGSTNIGALNIDGSGHIEVTMGRKAHPKVAGVILRLERDSGGLWTCVIDANSANEWREAYRPSGC